jgi:hypothetical protein
MSNDLSDSVTTALQYPQLAGWHLINRLLTHLVRTPATAFSTQSTIGTNVFEREWDVLILLDTGRVDALRAVAPEYEFIQTVDQITSVGAASPEWTAATFVEQYRETLAETAYLSANATAREILEKRTPATRSLSNSHLRYNLLARHDTVTAADLGKLEHLWQYESVGETGRFGHPKGSTPPRYVTDRGIAVAKDDEYDRLVLHYHQPHAPYTARATAENRDLHEYEENRKKYVAKTGDYERIWETYLDDLRAVLDEVAIVLDNIDAENVVISADHGEALGEWGVWAHPIGSVHPKIRQVPWIQTSATDSGSYTPEIPAPSEREEKPDSDSDELLEALGYKF